jgi:Cdc6-like AAA superfamily ATPase
MARPTQFQKDTPKYIIQDILKLLEQTSKIRIEVIKGQGRSNQTYLRITSIYNKLTDLSDTLTKNHRD